MSEVVGVRSTEAISLRANIATGISTILPAYIKGLGILTHPITSLPLSMAIAIHATLESLETESEPWERP